MTNLIIYHAKCVDGIGALWAATKHLGLYSEMHAATYGSEPPDVTGKNVYILDFSYPRDVILEMTNKAASLHVIDHHVTAEKNLEDLPNVKFDAVCSQFVGGTRRAFIKATQNPTTPDSLTLYAADVPHVMVYPERGIIPVVKTPNKIKIGAGKFTLEGVGFSLPKPSSRW